MGRGHPSQVLSPCFRLPLSYRLPCLQVSIPGSPLPHPPLLGPASSSQLQTSDKGRMGGMEGHFPAALAPPAPTPTTRQDLEPPPPYFLLRGRMNPAGRNWHQHPASRPAPHPVSLSLSLLPRPSLPDAVSHSLGKHWSDACSVPSTRPTAGGERGKGHGPGSGPHRKRWSQ